MPRPGKRWRHIIINTHGSWLHGDQRGFRNRGPRIHSAGDYKHRPPNGEHANLLKYMKEKCPKEVKISRALRPVAGRAIVQFVLDNQIPVLACSYDEIHAHFLVELDDTSRSFEKSSATRNENRRAR